ncbi:MAG: bifunctional metallophosphatase/5-nucleotidase, partial [Akkermansiaceae bacterium]|nr:bifunctional metallophosphatase/5-nucleotidase [Akkermansiaceae bacterium]
PWAVKVVAGIRIGLIGLTTPGLPFWLSPKQLGGVIPLDPVEVLKKSVAALKAEKVNAIVVMGHMGWRAGDDFANPVHNLLETVEGVDVYLAGHTHQDQPSWMTGKTLCTQANYYGIHCGRVDLTFDADTHKLLNRRAFTVLMDGRFELDPVVMEMSRPDLAISDEHMARKVGTFKEPVTGTGRGNGMVRLFCQAFDGALKRQGHPVDGIFHGSFSTGDVVAGEKTVADCWDWLPFENELVVGEFSAADLIKIVAEDRKDARSDRELWPFEMATGADGSVTNLLRDGKPVAPDARYRIAFNVFDAQSAGQKLMILRGLMEQSSTKRTETGVFTRGALIDYLLERI